MKKLLLIIASLFTLALPALADSNPTPPPDKLQTALADLINKSVQVAGDAKDFLVGQLPDVVKQLLAWKAAQSLATDLVGVIALLLMAYNARKFVAFIRKEEFDIDDGTDFPTALTWGVVSGVITMIGVIASLDSMNLIWLQIWIAPKVYLIEYARTFIK